MKYTVIDCEQGTPEWHAARIGRVTGSKADVVMSEGKRKGEPSVQRANYCYELAEQRVTGEPAAQGFVSDAMRWGTEHEPFARIAYEGMFNIDVEQTGFIRCDEAMVGCSLDGHVGAMSGIVEIKCPSLRVHIDYLKGGVLPSAYRWQVVHNLLVTGAAWCDFVSYRPGFRLFVVRAHAKDLPLDEYNNALTAFLAEVDRCHEEIQGYTQ